MVLIVAIKRWSPSGSIGSVVASTKKNEKVKSVGLNTGGFEIVRRSKTTQNGP